MKMYRSALIGHECLYNGVKKLDEYQKTRKTWGKYSEPQPELTRTHTLQDTDLVEKNPPHFSIKQPHQNKKNM